MKIKDSTRCLGKAIVLLLSTVFVGSSRAASDKADVDTSAPTLGSRIPDLRFKDIRALNRSLSELGTPKAWVLVFTTTHCPLVRQTLPKLVEIQKMHKAEDARFLAVNVGVDRRLKDNDAADNLNNRERMRVAVRVDTNDVVQLICEHPNDLQPSVGGHEPVSVWGWKPQAAEL